MSLEALLQELDGIQEQEKEQVSKLILDLITDTDTRDKIFSFHQHTLGMDSAKRDLLLNHLSDLMLDNDAQEKFQQLYSLTKGLAIPRRNRLFNHFHSLITDSTLDDIFWELCGVRDDPKDSNLTREEVLQRIKRYIKSSIVNFRKNQKGEFKPELTSRMMVEINFTGIGGEHNDKHFGIVWNSDPMRDNVLVIPTTSLKEDKKFYEYYFNIGKVDFLNKDTVVMLDQTVSISHKRIINETFIDPSSGAKTPVFISQDQEWRIRDGIRASYFGHVTLYTYLINNFRSHIPEMTNEPVQYDHLLRPFTLVSNDPEQMQYSLIDDPQTIYKILWRNSGVPRHQRDLLINDWHYALGEHHRHPQTNKRLGVKTPRRNNITAAYSNLLSAIAP